MLRLRGLVRAPHGVLYETLDMETWSSGRGTRHSLDANQSHGAE